MRFFNRMILKMNICRLAEHTASLIDFFVSGVIDFPYGK